MSEELINAPEEMVAPAENQVENVAETVAEVAETVVEEAAPAVEETVEVVENAVEEAAPEAETVTEEPRPRKMRQIENPYGSLENFDWNKIDADGERYSADEKAQLEERYTKSFKSVDENAVIMGKVVSINAREIVVNIGFKSDGVINASELRYNPNLKIGDEIEVYVESQEDANGQLQLSHKRALILKSWQRVNEAYDNQEIITGYVKGKTKGGLIVDVFGIEAFLPGSQIDVKPIRDYDIYVDKTMEFKVVKINHDYKNVVVSHKALIEAEHFDDEATLCAALDVAVDDLATFVGFVDAVPRLEQLGFLV